MLPASPLPTVTARTIPPLSASKSLALILIFPALLLLPVDVDTSAPSVMRNLFVVTLISPVLPEASLCAEVSILLLTPVELTPERLTDSEALISILPLLPSPNVEALI